MESRRYIRLFRNGRNQALRIPREMELEGEEAIIYREGGRLIIEPFPGVEGNLPALDAIERKP